MPSFLGLHMNNMTPPSAKDWSIIQRVRPGNVVFLPGHGVGPKDIEKVLKIEPGCHIIMRPYLDPQRLLVGGGTQANPNYGAVKEYAAECAQFCADYAFVPAPQRHIQPFNEANMPVNSAGWEGFGTEPWAMQAFDDQFCYVADYLHDSAPSWRVVWPGLTIGNKDAWFKGDHFGHYYMHGVSGCYEKPSPQQAELAKQECRCRMSLLKADDYGAHVYIDHTQPESFKAQWRGLRHKTYIKWLPKAMPVWITEGGFWTPSDQPQVLLDWLNLLYAGQDLQGVALWILGQSQRWGDHYGNSATVERLAAWAAAHPMRDPLAGAGAPLPTSKALHDSLRQAALGLVSFKPNPADGAAEHRNGADA